MSDEKIEALEQELKRVRAQRTEDREANALLKKQLAEFQSTATTAEKAQKAAEAALAKAQEKLGALDSMGEIHGDLKAQIAKMEADAAKAQARLSQHLTLADEFKLPADARDFFLHQYDKIDGDDKPDLPTFMQGQTDSPIFKAFATAAPASTPETPNVPADTGEAAPETAPATAAPTQTAPPPAALPSRSGGRVPEPANGAPYTAGSVTSEAGRDPVAFLAKYNIKVNNPDRFS